MNRLHTKKHTRDHTKGCRHHTKTPKRTPKRTHKRDSRLFGEAFRFDCNDSTTDLYLVKNRISDYVFETEHREIDEDSLTKTIGSVTYEFDEDETFKVIPTSNLKEILKLYRFLFYKIEDTILSALENSWMKEEDN